MKRTNIFRKTLCFMLSLFVAVTMMPVSTGIAIEAGESYKVYL